MLTSQGSSPANNPKRPTDEEIYHHILFGNLDSEVHNDFGGLLWQPFDGAQQTEEHTFHDNFLVPSLSLAPTNILPVAPGDLSANQNSGVFEAEFLQEYNLSYRSLISNDLQSNGIFPSTQGAQRSYDAPSNPRLLPPAANHDSATWHRAQTVHPFRDLHLAPAPDAPDFSPLHNIDLLLDAPTRAPGPPPTASGTRPSITHEPWLPAAPVPPASDWQPLPDIPPPNTARHPLGGAWETVAGADDPSADGVSPWSMVGSHEGLTPLSFELVSDGDDGRRGSTEASSGRASGCVTPDGSSPGSAVVVVVAPTTRVWEAPAQGSRKRKDGRLTDEAREKTKLVRRAKACVRCRMLKIECDQDNPCRTCCHVRETHRLFFQPCSREDLGDVSLVRHGNGKFGQERISFRRYLWKNPKMGHRTIEIRWTLAGNISVAVPNFKVSCSEFAPREGDLTTEEWQVKGKKTTVNLPPFACADDRALVGIVHAMVERSRGAVEDQMLQSLSDELACATFKEAHRYGQKNDSKMIKLALRICSTAAFCQGWGSIVGTETLDTPNVDNAEAGYCGTKPISPALCHQIDVAFLNMMAMDEKRLVKELKQAMFKSKPKPWYEIFLAYFVIMWHLKFIHGEAVGFMKCREQTDSGNHVGVFVTRMAGEWNHSAKNMLYHFRYVLHGNLPFQKAIEDIEGVRSKANLDLEAVSYMKRVVTYLNRNGWMKKSSTTEKKKANDQSSDEWIRQLFEE